MAQALQSTFSAGDAAGATQLFAPDAIFEDMALHTRVEGQLQIQRYLARGLASLPYGPGASVVAHVAGSDEGAATNGKRRCLPARWCEATPRSNLTRTQDLTFHDDLRFVSSCERGIPVAGATRGRNGAGA